MSYGKWKTLLIVNGCMVFNIMFAGCCYDSYSLITLQSQREYVFDIRAECFAEISRFVFVRVMKDRSVLLEQGLGVTQHAHELKFALIETDDIVAIVETANPHVIVALFDLDMQQYWTCMGGNAVGIGLLQRLNKNHTETSFILCHDYALKHESAQISD